MKKIRFFLCVFLFLFSANLVKGENLPRVPHLRVLNSQLDSILKCMLIYEHGDDLINIDKEKIFLVLLITEKDQALYKIEGMVLGGKYTKSIYNDYNDLHKWIKRVKKKLFGYFLYDGYVVLVYSTTVLKQLFVREDTTRTFDFMELYPPRPPLKPGVVPPPPSRWEPISYYFTLDQDNFTFDDAMR